MFSINVGDVKSHVITLAAGFSVGFVLAKLLNGVPMFFKLTYRSKPVSTGNDKTKLQVAKGPPGDYKLVIGARQDLQMGKGKVAAQCCHAAVACFEDAQESQESVLEEWMEQGKWVELSGYSGFFLLRQRILLNNLPF